jgi:TetR/AcrR family transcriptional regulator, regulator of cefoperazone and chloramphenicol sensitivity
MRQVSASSQATYDKLVDAAVGEFAALGLDGASTRDIARAANVALSAISYHFGSKADLYRAAVQRAADWMVEPLQPTFQQIERLIAGKPSADDARTALIELTDAVAEIMLAPGEEGEAAVQLSMRELVIPTAARDIIAARIIEPAIAYATSLIDLMQIPGQRNGAAAMEATALFGPITIYRMLHNHSLGTMSVAQAKSIQRAVRGSVRRNILALAAPEKLGAS